MKKLPWAAFGLLAASMGLINVFAGCGSESSGDDVTGNADGGDGSSNTDATPSENDGATNPDDGGTLPSDASVNDAAECKAAGQTCAKSTECCTANCNATSGKCEAPIGPCKAPAEACKSPTDCCTGSCVNGSCSSKACVPDQPVAGSCGQAGDCCSGICTGGKCASANGGSGSTCRTAGNPCANATECCSNLCNNGVCSDAVSYCTQQNEICTANIDCCTGNCVKTGSNLTGYCGAPLGSGAGNCSPSGTLCNTGVTDGGAACEGACCSRSCGPFGGSNGFRVCQPASGCQPTGEVCRADSDCCGWSGSPDPKAGFVECSKPSPTAEYGRCNNGNACREPGAVCKVGGTESCSVENNCCETIGTPSSNCNSKPEECCGKDALGIPRCLVHYVGNCTTPQTGTTCATSADCCGNPCINNKCSGSTCIGQGGQCTTSADCCPGIPCVQAPGSTKGFCGGTLLPDGGVSDAGTSTPDAGPDSGTKPDSGTTCSLYGQTCAGSSDCCSGVPCTLGRCRYP